MTAHVAVTRAEFVEALIRRAALEAVPGRRVPLAHCKVCRAPMPIKRKGTPRRFCSSHCAYVHDVRSRREQADASPLRSSKSRETAEAMASRREVTP